MKKIKKIKKKLTKLSEQKKYILSRNKNNEDMFELINNKNQTDFKRNDEKKKKDTQKTIVLYLIRILIKE